jgi:hypothetical protein
VRWTRSSELNRYVDYDLVKVAMDGKTFDFRGSDDISIPIEVWTEYGLPEIWVRWIAAGGALLTAFMGAGAAFYGALGKMFHRLGHKS